MNSLRSTPPTVAEVTAAVSSICKRYRVARLQIFGSLASGRAHSGSDVDLLVEFLPGARVGLLEMGGLKEELEERLGCAVDLVSRAAAERGKNPYRRRSILAAPLTVYAR